MKIATKFGIPATALAALLATTAVAQETGDPAPDQTTQDQEAMSENMMGGDMSGMEGMMPMMEKMAPMMEACMEMMQATTDQAEAHATELQEG